MNITVKELKKYVVLSNDGHNLGKVSDAILKDKWRIAALSLKVEKTKVLPLGKKKPFLSNLIQDVQVEKIKAVTDKVVLGEPLQTLGPLMFEHDEASHVSRLLKMEVTGANGVKVGNVEDILVDTDNWKNPSIVVKLNREILDQIKIEKPLIKSPRVTLSFIYVVNIADVVMLNVDIKTLAMIMDSHSIKKVP